MSTLGRKAMKKTLERLKEDAFGHVELFMDVLRNLRKEVDDMSEEVRNVFDLFSEYTPSTILSLLRYIQALEDYGYELDEEWDKLLKRIEQAQQRKPSEKETSYRV